MRIGVYQQPHAAIARRPRMPVVQVETIDLAVDLQRDAGGRRRGDDAIHVRL